MNLKSFLITTAVSITTLALSSTAQAFNQSDVDELLNTGFCSNCDLSNANFSFATVDIFSLSESNLTRTDFLISRILGNRVGNNNFTDAIFQFANIDIRDFVGNDFINANFENSLIRNTLFRENIFTGSNFAFATIEDSEFISNDLTEVDFSNASLENVDFFTNFVGSSFQNTRATNSTFVNADFTDVDFMGANFSNTDLTGSNLTQEQLDSFESFTGILPDGTRIGIPEPSTIIGLGVLATFGAGRSFKRKLAKTKKK